jgi:hypothetical protein
MKKFIFLSAFCLLLTCCSIENKSKDNVKTCSSEIGLLADKICDETSAVSANDVEKFLADNIPVKLGKWVFCDYYADTTQDAAISTQISPSETINDWGSDIWSNGTPETGYYVSGVFKNSVRFIFKNKDKNKFHIYEYLEYGSDYGTKNVWFGDRHVTYFNPVTNGNISSGSPYLEIFPDPVTNDILELRIEKTSYFKYRGIFAGNETDDPGSTEAELFSALGNPETAGSVSTINDIPFGERNTYISFNSGKNAYIHYSDKSKRINVRIFLSKDKAGTMRIGSLYFIDFMKT